MSPKLNKGTIFRNPTFFFSVDKAAKALNVRRGEKVKYDFKNDFEKAEEGSETVFEIEFNKQDKIVGEANDNVNEIVIFAKLKSF